MSTNRLSSAARIYGRFTRERVERERESPSSGVATDAVYTYIRGVALIRRGDRARAGVEFARICGTPRRAVVLLSRSEANGRVDQVSVQGDRENVNSDMYLITFPAVSARFAIVMLRLAVADTRDTHA